MEEEKDGITEEVLQAIEKNEDCVTLESLDLETIPVNVLKTLSLNPFLKVLNLQYNDLIDLPDEIGLLLSLEELYLNGNQLSKLPNSIGELSRLKHLQLDENCLTELPCTLTKLHSLQVLEVVGNKIHSLHDDIFQGLKSLSVFKGDENSFSSLPDSFSVLSELTILELADNQLNKLPNNIGHLHKLKVVNLSQNKIEKLPESFSELRYIESMDISYNHMVELPENLKSAENLKYFHAANNRFMVLPNWFSRLSNIIELNLSENELNDMPLPSNFGEVAGNTLVTLDLSGNKITELPSMIGLLHKLKSFHLGSTILELERKAFQNGNWLPRLPESFSQMDSLTKLHLDENKLASLPDNFGHLRNLEWLDLSQNLIYELPKTFCKLTKLWYLQFSKNNLEHLPEDFGNLCNLVELKLDSNNIAVLPDSFGNLQKVQTVDLYRNKLTEIPKVLLKLKNLKRLDLDDNKLKIKAVNVPRLTTPLQYAPRNESLKGTWRGKLREDINIWYTRPDQNLVSLVEKAELECNADDEPENYEEEYSERMLELAMRKGLSIWKSHTGPDTREELDILPKHETYRFEPQTDNRSMVIFEDATGTIESCDEEEQLTSEDWDKEADEALIESYMKKGLQVKREVHVRDQLQDILQSYPPAKQALTKSAMYKSIYRKNVPLNVNTNTLPANDSDGQFDDAE